MPLIALEHSPTAYWLDFAVYGALCLALVLLLVLGGPHGSGLLLTLWALTGVAVWTLVEYLLHRHVLHGVAPFSRWHAGHHRRPTALMGSPTWLSLALFAVLAAAPAWWLLGLWPACALSCGLLSGYLVYGLTHHATHHGVRGPLGRSAWMAQRRRSHAQHHGAHHPDRPARQAAGQAAPDHYGVSTGLWDHVFGQRVHTG